MPSVVSETSSESDNDDLGHNDPPEPSFSLDVSTSVDDVVPMLEKMSKELDGLVRFVRRGVEAVSGGGSGIAPVFDVLSFALEDWDH